MNRRDNIIIGLISIYILLLPLAPSSKIEWILLSILAGAGIIYLFELLKYKDSRESFKKDFKVILLDTFSLLFVGLILIMTLSATYSENKIASLKEALRFVSYGYIYFFIRFRVRKEQMHELLIKVYLLSLAIVSFIGLYDFYTSYSQHYSFSTILNTSRVKSTLGHPNAHGAYLILAIFPSIIIALRKKSKERWAYLSLALLLCVNLALTFSRNAWLAFAIGILLLTVIYSWKFIFLCIIPIIFGMLSPNIMMRIEQLRDVGGVNEGRVKLWKVAEKMVSEHFFFGVGSGNYIFTYKDYVKRFPDLQISEAEALPPHNTYIKAFTELGIVGAMVFLLLCIEILRKIFEIRGYCKGIVEKFYSGYFVSAICFFIMNCFDDLFFAPKVTINFIIFVSLAFSIGHGITVKKFSIKKV